ncbi:MAG: hypothetical protein ACJ8GN_27815 [Longimicrobiaceae bacterium]
MVATVLTLALSVLARPLGAQNTPAAPAPAPPARCAEADARGSCTLHDVSIIQLIARPEQFDGRKVRVIGYLWLEFEGNAIYLSEGDQKHGLTKNGLWVDFARGTLETGREYSGHYVLVEGIFRAGRHGHMSLWSGTIEGITRATLWH